MLIGAGASRSQPRPPFNTQTNSPGRFHEESRQRLAPFARSKPCPSTVSVCVRRSLPPFHDPNVFLASPPALILGRRAARPPAPRTTPVRRGGSTTTTAATSSRRTMPRSRGSEPPQRASPRAPLHLKTTASSEANAAHHRPVADRASPKVADRHSPRSPLPEKKRAAGTRVAELEAKLGKVQDELKKLREQLASAEAAKKDAQVALEEAKKRVRPKGGSSPASASAATSPLSAPPSAAVESAKKTEEDLNNPPQPAAEEEENESSINSPATDVFEVVRAESGNKENQTAAADDCEEVSCGEKAAVGVAEKVEVLVVEEEETKKMIEEETKNAAAETDDGGAEKESPEVAELKAKLAEKDTEIAALAAENAELKKQAGEAAKKAEEEAAARASQAELDLKEGAAREARMGELLRASEAAREALDGELRRLRVQTEQWRKAAEAAAAVLGGDNHLTGLAGTGNGWGSPATMPDGDEDEGFGGKRKGGAGIRMLGDLWKKKGNSK